MRTQAFVYPVSKDVKFGALIWDGYYSQFNSRNGMASRSYYRVVADFSKSVYRGRDSWTCFSYCFYQRFSRYRANAGGYCMSQCGDRRSTRDVVAL